MRYNSSRSLELLRVGSGQPNAQFRDGQEEAIKHLVEGHGRLLVVQKQAGVRALFTLLLPAC